MTSLYFRRVQTELYDESGVEPGRFAIYTLSDPRDIRDVRYVGQTGAPRRRLLQHLTQAQLWLPDEVPWWVKQPKLRPLYTWIRALYHEEARLPVMVISHWAPTLTAARAAERALIDVHLAKRTALFNIETQFLHGQIPLL